jgi:pimeloyl-ACP methyl ester carboxylesterase
MPVAGNIYYHDFQGSDEGQRPPIVLIHGAGGTFLYWPAEMRRLAGYRVFAPDLPGHGKSAGRGRQSITDYAEMLLEWLEALGIHSAVLVGHSMGSAIAISIALDYPEHVLGLGLLGSSARLKVSPQILEGVASQTTYLSAIDAIVQRSFSPNAPARLTELAAERMAETRPSVLHGDFLACNGFDEMARIEAINQPTLIVCGMDDQMTPLRYSQYLADSIQTAALEVVQNAGHMVMLERPQRVAALLNDFMAGVTY